MILAPQSHAEVCRGTQRHAFLIGLLALTGCLLLFATSPASAQEAAPATLVEEGGVSPSGTEVVQEELVIPAVPLLDRFAQGGWIMFAILALSLVMGTFTIERLVHLRRSRILPPGLADRARQAWKAGDMNAILAAVDKQPSVLGSAIRVLVKHRHLSGSDASALAGDEVSRLMRRHLQKAYPLAIVATLSPLLGLLGTVTGMIDAFEVVAIAGSLGDASLLAAGIAKALVTTAFGLIVAIPALGLYHHFRSRTHELSLEVEEEAGELISEWFHAGPGAVSEAK